MENLRYSGRGRRGGFMNARGKGRGGTWRGGRGRGRGSSWVRSRDDGSFSTAEATPPIPLRSASPTSESSSISSGPILSGPRHFGRHQGRGRFPGRSSFMRGRGRGRGRGRMNYYQAPQNTNTWRRTTDKADTMEENENSDQNATIKNSLQLDKSWVGVQIEEMATESDMASSPTRPEMKKVGTNKLVLSTKTNPPPAQKQREASLLPTQGTESGKFPPALNDNRNAATASSLDLDGEMTTKGTNNISFSTQSSEAHENPTTGTAVAISGPPNQERKMIAKGKNKLVLAKSTSAQDDNVKAPVLINNAGTNNLNELTMISKGRNKLVLAKSFDDQGAGNTMVAKGSNKLVLTKIHKDQDFKFSGEKRQSENNASSWRTSNRGPAVKRIKISGLLEGTETAQVQEGEKKQDEETTRGKNTDTSGTLTDFAYRETSSNRPRGGRFSTRGGRGGRGRQQPRGQNMGLVRVNPDESKTPICPIFLRGIRCENERCTKRHDVPIESARPVCSFFQRHGQCLKGNDCPFRHVKVNPMATLCPSFNLLGYCDDDQCVMKHVTVNKSAKRGGFNNRNSGRWR